MAEPLIHGILPASGDATRMRGLPKFLLPCDSLYTTLLERHIDGLLEVCETVWIPTRPDLIHIVESLNIASERVVLLTLKTQSMTETVRRVVELSSANRFVMAMPDTYFHGALPFSFLAEDSAPLSLACWQIREEQFGKLGQVKLDLDANSPEKYVVSESVDKDPDCRYAHSWGAMGFDRHVMAHARDEMPHTGYLIPELLTAQVRVAAKVISGEYFDCGTPTEYLAMLKKSQS